MDNIKNNSIDAVKRIELEDIISRIGDLGHVDIYLYKDKIVLFTIDANDRKRAETHDERSVHSFLKIDAFCLIIIEKGECVFNIDYRPLRVDENKVILLTDRHIIQPVSVSDDFRCYIMFVAKDYLQNIMKDTKMLVPDVSAAVSFFSNPVIRFEQDEFALLQDNLERLRRNINRSDHSFWKELVQNEFANLFFEVRNIMMLKLGDEPKKQKYTRREQVLVCFFQLLLEHSRTEREVAFYADKLCVTPVYLSRLIKRTIGKPAIRIIHELAVSDAMYLLRRPDMNIQDAADAMNFPDRETFSKFFKKIAGVSPGEYRKKAGK